MTEIDRAEVEARHPPNLPDRSPGEIAYDAYARAVNGRSHSGDRLPMWREITKPTIREGWENAARSIRLHFVREIEGLLGE